MNNDVSVEELKKRQYCCIGYISWQIEFWSNSIHPNGTVRRGALTDRQTKCTIAQGTVACLPTMDERPTEYALLRAHCRALRTGGGMQEIPQFQDGSSAELRGSGTGAAMVMTSVRGFFFPLQWGGKNHSATPAGVSGECCGVGD